MSGQVARRASSHIGALTSKDHYREAVIQKKINDAYKSMSSTSSPRLRRRQLRSARRHERALHAQRHRPQSALYGTALVLVGLLVVVAVTELSSTLLLILAVLFVADVLTLRHRRRVLRRS
jgi:Flp pilus assembly protein TadB